MFSTALCSKHLYCNWMNGGTLKKQLVAGSAEFSSDSWHLLRLILTVQKQKMGIKKRIKIQYTSK